MVFSKKTNHPSNFSFSAIFLTDKIKQHVLFLISGNSDEYFYLYRDARRSGEVRCPPLEMAFRETAKNKTIQGKNIFWALLHQDI